MDETEAKTILAAQMRDLRTRSYADFRVWALEKHLEARDVKGPSGTDYQIEVQAVWDSGRNLRVMVAIDDGGWRAFMPLTSDFIIAPDGAFIGE